MHIHIHLYIYMSVYMYICIHVSMSRSLYLGLHVCISGNRLFCLSSMELSAVPRLSSAFSLGNFSPTAGRIYRAAAVNVGDVIGFREH